MRFLPQKEHIAFATAAKSLSPSGSKKLIQQSKGLGEELEIDAGFAAASDCTSSGLGGWFGGGSDGSRPPHTSSHIFCCSSTRSLWV
jgi:hypothetical protein